MAPGAANLTATKRFTGTRLGGFLSGGVLGSGGGGGTIFVGRAGLEVNFDPPGTTQYDHDMQVPFRLQWRLID